MVMRSDIPPQVAQRLDRIEDKIDRLTEALVSLAKIEERIVAIVSHQDRTDSHLANMEVRVGALERQTIGRGIFFRWLDRGGMAVVGAAIAILVNQLLGYN